MPSRICDSFYAGTSNRFAFYSIDSMGATRMLICASGTG